MKRSAGPARSVGLCCNYRFFSEVHMGSSALDKVAIFAGALDVRPLDEGADEALLPASEFERVVKWTETLRAEGYSCELRGDTRVFKRGWSYCLVKPIVGGVFRLRILDASQCPTSRITENGLEWAGITLLKQHEGILLAGPAWRHVQTWSVAHYFFGPIEQKDAISLIGSQLREQSPRVVGPWTAPDEVWFDVRALGVDAKVRITPCSLSQACDLFQRPIALGENKIVLGVLIEVTGAEKLG
ncbi:MAG: hypothetical protein U0359_32565 [Byssovorax sp.]